MRPKIPCSLSTLSIVVAGILLSVSGRVEANPWTRDAGHGYVNVNYATLGGDSFFGKLGEPAQPITYDYRQHTIGLYGEFGLIDRFLTGVIDSTLYRQSGLATRGYTQGMGDLRLGLWSAVPLNMLFPTARLVTPSGPLHLAVGIVQGLPTGDAQPSVSSEATDGAAEIAAVLPTGDGEWDTEFALAIGHAFRPVSAWPFEHYSLLRLGYWLRTKGFADAFNWQVELGTRLPMPIVERFTLIVRFFGSESFLDGAPMNGGIGLGNGVSYRSWGIELFGRIWKGLGASAAFNGAFAAQGIIAGALVKGALSYEF